MKERKNKKTALAPLKQQVTISDVFIFQANRTQSLNYGCIVENPQTHEVRAERGLGGHLLVTQRTVEHYGEAPVFSNKGQSLD